VTWLGQSPFNSAQSVVREEFREKCSRSQKSLSFQNDQESNGERSGIRSTLKAVNRSRQAFLLSEQLQGIANDTPKTLQISSSIFAQ
jgi:hypothetical protein